ncbi:MAG: hypothetical protein Kow00108_20930 [Calditrichia bacterium]
MKSKIIVVYILMFLAIPLYSQIIVPIEEQVPILAKAINYVKSNNLTASDSKEFMVAVLYKKNDAFSEKMMKQAVKAFNKKTKKIRVFDKKIKAIALEFENGLVLEKQLIVNDVKAVFLCAGLKNDIEEINSVIKANSLISMSPQMDDIVNGNAVMGVTLAEGNVVPYVNYVVAKEYRLDLDLQFLNFAEVIR